AEQDPIVIPKVIEGIAASVWRYPNFDFFPLVKAAFENEYWSPSQRESALSTIDSLVVSPQTIAFVGQLAERNRKYQPRTLSSAFRFFHKAKATREMDILLNRIVELEKSSDVDLQYRAKAELRSLESGDYIAPRPRPVPVPEMIDGAPSFIDREMM